MAFSVQSISGGSPPPHQDKLNLISLPSVTGKASVIYDDKLQYSFRDIWRPFGFCTKGNNSSLHSDLP